MSGTDRITTAVTVFSSILFSVTAEGRVLDDCYCLLFIVFSRGCINASLTAQETTRSVDASE